MSSTRAFHRRTRKRLGLPMKRNPQQFRNLPDGGYAVLHPTKGWRPISAARLRAQGLLAAA